MRDGFEVELGGKLVGGAGADAESGEASMGGGAEAEGGKDEDG